MKRSNLKGKLLKLLKRNHLLSVSDFLELLKKEGSIYNKTSVYRALEQLFEEKLVCRHSFSLAETKYELREHHHSHLVCVSCGAVKTRDCDYKEPKKIGSFLVNHHHITFFGLCRKCQHSN